MDLTSRSFKDGAAIPGEFAFAAIDTKQPKNHVAPSANHNPHLAWSDAPAGTQSFALVCHDPDVPTIFDDANKEDREIPASLPRRNFYHWLLWNIPATVHEIAVGSHSGSATPHGKNGPEAPGGMRHGINDYTPDDPSAKDKHYGYDGPCPPWNDTIKHRYCFTLYALRVKNLDVTGDLKGADVLAALKGNVLAEAKIAGTYTLNPRLASV